MQEVDFCRNLSTIYHFIFLLVHVFTFNPRALLSRIFIQCSLSSQPNPFIVYFFKLFKCPVFTYFFLKLLSEIEEFPICCRTTHYTSMIITESPHHSRTLQSEMNLGTREKVLFKLYCCCPWSCYVVVVPEDTHLPLWTISLLCCVHSELSVWLGDQQATIGSQLTD